MPTYFSLPEQPKPDARPAVPRSTHSFSRFDSSPARSTRSKNLSFDLDPVSVTESAGSSPEASDDEDDHAPLIPDPLPEGWDEIPPDIVALCDK